jgi:hypothetical protein
MKKKKLLECFQNLMISLSCLTFRFVFKMILFQSWCVTYIFLVEIFFCKSMKNDWSLYYKTLYGSNFCGN